MNEIAKDLETTVSADSWPFPYIDAFIKYMEKQNYSKNTINSYKLMLYRMGTILRNLEGVSYTLSYLAGHLEQGIRAYARERRSAASYNLFLSAVKTFQRWLSKQEASTISLKSIKRPKRLPPMLNMAEFAYPINYDSDDWQDLRNSCIFELVVFSGVSCEEIINMQWKDFDVKDDSLSIGGRYARRLPLHHTATRIMLAYRDAYPCDKRCRMGSKPIFISSRHQAFKATVSIRLIIQKKLAAIGKHQYKPLQFRRALGVHYVNRGCNLREVQILLGYSSLASMRTYELTNIPKLRETYDVCFPRAKRIKDISSNTSPVKTALRRKRQPE